MNKRDKKESEVLIPVSLINASQYCRRLAYLQFVHQEWQDTADTVKGRRVHKNIDRVGASLVSLSSSEELKKFERPIKIRSLSLSSERLGLTSRLDLLETEGAYVIPIEYKKGKQPDLNNNKKETFTPAEVQLCAQAMLLKDRGYSCKKGMIYYAGSEKRVPVKFTNKLMAQTKRVISRLREDIKKTKAPPPLEDSPKCPSCSLVNICLPEEFHLLKKKKAKARPVSIESETKFPLYVQSHYGKVSKKGLRLEIKIDEENKKSVPIADVSHLVLLGNVSVTTPCLHELMRRGISIVYHSYSGWFLGITQGMWHKNASLR